MTRIASAWAAAERADRRENGAIPPGVWQPAHFWPKIGPTSAQLGGDVRLLYGVVPEPAAIATAPTAIAATAPSARPSLLRLTIQR